MNINLKISGSSVNPYLEPGSLFMPDAINQRTVLTFNLKALVGVLVLGSGVPVTLDAAIWVPQDYGMVSEAVALSEDYGIINDVVVNTEDRGTIDDLFSGAVDHRFSGTIDSIEKVFLDQARTRVGYAVRAVDNHFIFDRRLVSESVVDSTVGDFIVDVLFTEYIEPEGITLGTVDGFDVPIEEAIFAYESITKVLDKLAAKTGYIWYINPDKSFHFVKRDTEDAPWSLTEDEDIRGLKVTDHREQYRNRQTIKDGVAESDVQTETFVADGEQQTFVVAFPILHEPTITVGGVAKTVGIRGVDDGKDFYWNKGKTEINSDAVYAAGSEVSISYIGQFDVIVEFADNDEILSRQTVEGGTGLYEAVESKRGLSTLDELTNIAMDRIRAFAALGKVVTFTTLKPGLQPGTIIPVDLPGLDVDNTDMLITEVTLQEMGAPGEFECAVKAVTGEAVGGWAKFFRDWMQPDETIQLINQNQVLTINKVIERTWIEADFPNVFHELYPAEDLFPAADLYPMFHPEKDAEYVEYSLDNVAAGRVLFVRQDRADGIITTRFLLKTNVIGNITDLAFYGDDSATLEMGTGLQIDSTEYVQAKTKLDIVQIIRTDIKGW